MLNQFTQPTGSTSKSVNTQAVAYVTGYTHEQVKILKTDLALSGVFVVIDDVTDKVYYVGSATGSVVSWSESGDKLTLVTSVGTYTLEGFHVRPQSMTTAFAKRYTNFVHGQRVFLEDVGYSFKYVSNRLIVGDLAVTEITSDDELHKLVFVGGMLEFDDYPALRAKESTNYINYQRKLRTKSAIGLVTYGDSITWGQGPAPASAQFPKPYPTIIAETITGYSQCTWTAQNKAYPGDTALVNYVRNIDDGSTGDISTIMLGVNDIKVAIQNGQVTEEEIPANVDNSVKIFTIIMRKYVAREILRGRCVVLMGMTQFAGSATSLPMGNLTECYLGRAYDIATYSVAAEFNCGHIDTKRTITEQFGVSESCHDGVHLRADFLEIIGKRFAAFFMNQDYKNPNTLDSKGVYNVNYLQNSVVSNVTLQRNLFTNGSSPPFLGGESDPEATGFMLPNSDEGGSVTIAFFAKKGNIVVYPSVNGNTDYSFNLILDAGAKQADYPSDVEIIPVLRDRQYIVSGRAISGNAPKNRTTENYSQIVTACYMHITSPGWHMLTFNVGPNTGVVGIEGLVCEDWATVRSQDVFGGISGSLVYDGSTFTSGGMVTGCSNTVTGEFNVTTKALVVENYRVEVEFTQDAAPMTYRVIYKAENQFRIQFYDGNNTLVNPTEFRMWIFGGR